MNEGQFFSAKPGERFSSRNNTYADNEMKVRVVHIYPSHISLALFIPLFLIVTSQTATLHARYIKDYSHPLFGGRKSSILIDPFTPGIRGCVLISAMLEI